MDCDNLFMALMNADCNDRSIFRLACLLMVIDIRKVMFLVNQGPSPGPVKIVNVETGKCVSVKSGLQADGTKVVQQSCSSSGHQQFRLHPSGRYPGYFLIKPTHSNKCIEIATASLAKLSCLMRRPTLDPRWAKQAFQLISVSNSDVYQVRSKSARGSCWTVPYMASSRNSINPVVNQANGTQLANAGCAGSNDGQKWSIRSASYTAPPPPTTAPPATTAPPTTAPPVTVPAALSGLTATAGADVVVLSWNDPGDGSITRYQVRERPGFDGIWWCWSGFGASPSGGKITYRVENLPSGAAYKFQARAQNAAGFGPAVEVSASTSAAASPPASVPAAPSGLSGAAGDQSIALSWTDPSDSSIIRYQFRERTDSEADWRCWRHIYNSTASTVAHTMPGITNDVRYRVQVRALNAVGASTADETSATPTAARTTPGP